MSIDYNEHHARTGDRYGTIHPDWKPGETTRFRIYVREIRTDNPPDQTHELTFVDRKYSDSDGYPIDAIASGGSWAEAFALAATWVDQALSTDHCIF
jgi:hypothetical protein